MLRSASDAGCPPLYHCGGRPAGVDRRSPLRAPKPPLASLVVAPGLPSFRSLRSRRTDGRRTTATAVATPDTGPPLASLEAARTQVPPFRSCDRKRRPPQHASKLGDLQNHEPRERLGTEGHGKAEAPKPRALKPRLEPPPSSCRVPPAASSCARPVNRSQLRLEPEL